MNAWSWYWCCWLTGVLVSFAVPETIALATGHPRNTLSWNIWTFFGGKPGESPLAWSATHFLVGGALAVGLVWLIGHLIFGLWR
jgi:hypothetical protein